MPNPILEIDPSFVLLLAIGLVGIALLFGQVLRKRRITETAPYFATTRGALAHLEALGSADAIAEYLGERGYVHVVPAGDDIHEKRNLRCPVALFLNITTGRPHRAGGLTVGERYAETTEGDVRLIDFPNVAAFIDAYDSDKYPWLTDNQNLPAEPTPFDAHVA